MTAAAVLAGRDLDTARRAVPDQAQAGEVVGGNGLLEPHDAEFGELLREGQRLPAAIWVLQEKPSAITSVCGFASLILGNRPCSPHCMDIS